MDATSVEIYEETIKTTEFFYRQIENGQAPVLQSFFIQTAPLFEQLFTGTETSKASSLLALSLQSPEQNLYRHVINVTILSLTLGKGLKLKPEKLSLLFKAGLLFDIGMTKISGSELTNIKQHTALGARILETLPGIPPEVISVALQHHERRDGSGFPKGLKDQEIHPMARIVGLADTFCNLAQVAPMQRRLSLHETVQEILQGKSLFDENCLRALLENVAFYPKDTWVKLSTGDIGKVVSENKGMPLRPVIKIYSEPDGERVYDEHCIDLKTATAIFIKQVLLEEQLREKGIDPQWL